MYYIWISYTEIRGILCGETRRNLPRDVSDVVHVSVLPRSCFVYISLYLMSARTEHLECNSSAQLVDDPPAHQSY